MGIIKDCHWVMCTGKASITVIVTVYNKENQISGCINSLIHQTEGNFKVMIVDDGSTDNSYEIIQEMVSDLPDFELFEIEHGGVSCARNFALSRLSSDYVIFVDGDDMLINYAIDCINKYLLKCSPDMLVYGFSHIMENGKLYHHTTKSSVYADKNDIRNNFTKIWNTGLMYSVCNKVFNVSIIKNNNICFENIDFGEDFAFSRKYLTFCQNIHFMDKALYHYTFHNDNSLSTLFRPNLFEIRTKEYYTMEEYFSEWGIDDNDSVEFLARRHIERVIGCIENEHSPHNPANLIKKYYHIKKFVSASETQKCTRYARKSSFKMKALIFPIKHKLYVVTFLIGQIMSACRNYFPRIFALLKMGK